MKISIDKNIPLLPEILSENFNISSFSGRNLQNSDLKGSDVLFVRSTTKVNEELLHNTPVKLVGTATSGTEHIDAEFLNKHNIQFGDAKGCNANSVAEYVIYSILKWHFEHKVDLDNKIIGIIGFGNIGKLVAKYSNLIGLKILINDQPLYDENFKFPDFVKHKDYDSIFEEADIITNHIPLTKSGKYATNDLINRSLLQNIKPDSLFIHASRGGIVNEEDLLAISDNLTLAIDVWKNEPEVNLDLLKMCMLASAHTAGYSRDGKLRGVKAMLDLFNKFTAQTVQNKKLDNELSEYNPVSIEKYNDLSFLFELLKKNRKFEYDHDQMRKLFTLLPEERILQFDLIRKNYPLRRESL